MSIHIHSCVDDCDDEEEDWSDEIYELRMF